MDAIRRFWYTWRRFEYWPWWFFYGLLWPVSLYYTLRSGSLAWFTAANPGIEDGGFFGEEKRKILMHIPEAYKPGTSIFLVENRTDWQEQIAQLPESMFPCVMKPDVGERGDDVVRFETRDALLNKVKTVEYNWILQEFVDYPLELGVYFARDPETGNGKVLSLTRKKFLTVCGNGSQTVEELMRKTDRGFLQIERIRRDNPDRLTFIPKAGEEHVVEAMGNHCLGTEFINASEHLCPEIDRIFDTLIADFDGFHIGRFDLKVRDFESLKKGETIRIFELNGVSSEPTHIYDSRISVFGAYREVLKFWRLLFQISSNNHRNGTPYTKPRVLLKHFISHHFG